jgi:hypothetical protein
MRVVHVSSKLWWLATGDEIRAATGTPVVQAIKTVVQAFEFAQAPTGLPPPNDGYHFQEGRFLCKEKSVAIKDLGIFNDGISIEIYSDTETNLAFLDQVIQLFETLGMQRPTTPPRIILQSMIVLEFPGPINKLAAHYDELSTLIGKEIGIEGQQQLRVIEFAIDPAVLPRKVALLNPTVFRLERRVNEEYDKNRFYSFANTHTENHIHILDRVDRLISN